MSAIAKEREQRASVMLRARLRGRSGKGDAQILDASSRGLLMSAPRPPERGEIVEVFVGRTVLVGQVRWNRGNQFGVVLQERIDVAALQRGGPVTQPARSRAQGSEQEQGMAPSDILFFAACAVAFVAFLIYIFRKLF